MAATKTVRKTSAKKKSAPVARAKKAANTVAKKAARTTHSATRRAAKVGTVLERVGRFIETGAAAVEQTLNAVEKRPAARKKKA